MKSKIKNVAAILIFLLFWIMLSEKINIEVIFIGAIISIIVYCLNRDFLIFFLGKGFQNLKKIIYFIEYLALLIKEIIIANFQVAKIVLRQELKITPCVVKYRTKLKKDLTRTILANSITLTPGTLTVKLNKDELLVHCLLEDYKESLNNSKFEKILLKIEE